MAARTPKRRASRASKVDDEEIDALDYIEALEWESVKMSEKLDTALWRMRLAWGIAFGLLLALFFSGLLRAPLTPSQALAKAHGLGDFERRFFEPAFRRWRDSMKLGHEIGPHVSPYTNLTLHNMGFIFADPYTVLNVEHLRPNQTDPTPLSDRELEALSKAEAEAVKPWTAPEACDKETGWYHPSICEGAKAAFRVAAQTVREQHKPKREGWFQRKIIPQ